MKFKRILTMLFIVLVFVCNVSVVVSAMNTGFSTEKMDLEEQELFLTNIDMSVVNDEPSKKEFECFDVNNDGLIAIGTSNSTKKTICIYTSDGDFKYGYTFDCSGSFGIEWDGDNMIIHFVRSDVAALFDAEGTNIELEKIQNTIDNNSYWNHSVFATQRTIGENQYLVKNNMGFLNFFASSYSQLIKTDVEGSETIIYDVSTSYAGKTIVLFIAVVLFIAIVISAAIREFIKSRHRI